MGITLSRLMAVPMKLDMTFMLCMGWETLGKMLNGQIKKGKADDLIEEIGGELKKELSSLLDNEFEKYVKKMFPTETK